METKREIGKIATTFVFLSPTTVSIFLHLSPSFLFVRTRKQILTIAFSNFVRSSLFYETHRVSTRESILLIDSSQRRWRKIYLTSVGVK